MLFQFFTGLTGNPEFDAACDRTATNLKDLHDRLKAISVRGRFNTVLLGVFNKSADFFEMKGLGEDATVLDVGFDQSTSYGRQHDEKTIELIAGWLRRLFSEGEGYAEKRIDLLSIVNSWELESVNRIVSARMTKT